MKIAFLLSILASVFFGGIPCESQTSSKMTALAAAQSITQKIEDTQLDGFLSSELTGPYATHGYVVSFLHLNSSPTAPGIRLLRRGRQALVATLSVWFQGAIQVQIEDVDITAGGETVVVGAYARLSHETEAKVADNDRASVKNFVVSFDASGKQKSTFDPGDFLGQRVCFAPDHTSWVLGISPEKDQSHSTYDLLRHFAPDGKLIGSYLPKSSLTWRKVDFSLARHQTFLRCGASSVATYLGVFKHWVEIPYDGSEPHQYLIDDPGKVKVTGLAMVGPGEVYATLQNEDTRGLYHLSLRADGTGAWELVKPALSGSPPERFQADNVWRVIGQDGDKAVYFSEKHTESTGAIIHAARVKDILPASPKGFASKP